MLQQEDSIKSCILFLARELFLVCSFRILMHAVGSGDNGAGVEIIEGYSKWSKQLWENLDRYFIIGNSLSLRIDKPIPKPEPGTPLKAAVLPKSEKKAPKVQNQTSEEPGENLRPCN